MGKGIALGGSTFVGDGFVAAGEANWLKGKEINLLWVVEGKLDDAADLLVVDSIDDAGDGDDIDAGFVQVVNGLQLDIKGVTHLAMGIGCMPNAIKLQVGVA